MLAALVAATPQPFLQTIVDVVPARTVFGRVCLLGDAAFVVRPHTAGATAKAARDAMTLARALKQAGRNIDAGLSGFEEMQIEFGRGATPRRESFAFSGIAITPARGKFATSSSAVSWSFSGSSS
jgi:hypothetical protein